MVRFKMNKDKVVATKGGHAIEFKKGEATAVPHHAIKEMLAAGGVMIDEVEDEAAPVSREPVDLDQRKFVIFEGFKTMVSRDSRGDFTANNVPNVKELNQIIGFKIDTKERDALWDEWQQEHAVR